MAREMRGDAYSQRVGLLLRHPCCIGSSHSSSLISPFHFIPEQKGADDEKMRCSVMQLSRAGGKIIL